MNMLEFWDKYTEFRKVGLGHKLALEATERLEKELPVAIKRISKILKINKVLARKQIMHGCGCYGVKKTTFK